MSDTALLPCPFCGEDAYDDMPTWRVFGARTGHEYAIACSSCEAVAPGDDDFTLAIAAWNTRAATETARAEGIALGIAMAVRACDVIYRTQREKSMIGQANGAGKCRDAILAHAPIPPHVAAARVLLDDMNDKERWGRAEYKAAFHDRWDDQMRAALEQIARGE
jgi:Lar family restriction alleviation protein